MKFDEIVSVLEDKGRGVHAYRAVIDFAQKAIAEDPDRAIGYWLLGVIAERFVDTTERQPINSAQTEAAFQNFKACAERLNTAFLTGQQDVVLALLNSLAQTGETR